MLRVALLSAAVLLAVTLSSASAQVRRFPEGPYFTVGCGFSHRNNDDPIVFPRAPGRSHNHTYIGNRSTNAFSTGETLRGGPSSCDTDSDSSTYWVPTLYEGREPVLPLVGLAYYVKRSAARVAPFPADMKMVAGNPEARRAQSTDIVSWTCGSSSNAPKYPTPPRCRADDSLQLRVDFPSCWNGRQTDSPDHKSHVAYLRNGVCPSSHPVALPTLSLIFIYPEFQGRPTLSSGRFAAHADFVNGWDEKTLALLVSGMNY